MAKSIKCSDTGVDCDWSTTAETEEELLKKVHEHAKEQHGFTEITPELLAKVKANIKDQ
jgi:predicted small metal-binding protein